MIEQIVEELKDEKGTFFRIEVKPEEKVIYTDWIGEQNYERATKGMLKELEVVKNTGFTKILNDNRKQRGAYPKTINNWMSDFWLPEITSAGLKYAATILSPVEAGKMSAEEFDTKSMGLIYRNFADGKEAELWLEENTKLSVGKKQNMYGLFTNEIIEKGEIAYQLEGKIVSEPTRTSIEIDNLYHIEDSFGMYINHSCNPSVKIYGKQLIAVKDIYPGDEITFDYNDHELIMNSPFTCHCCGRMIVGKELRPLEIDPNLIEDKFIYKKGELEFWQIGRRNLHQLTKFVYDVYDKIYSKKDWWVASAEDLKHMQDEDVIYFPYSIYFAFKLKGKIVGTVKVTRRNDKLIFPIEEEFGININEELHSRKIETNEIWHWGRLAIDKDLLIDSKGDIVHSRKVLIPIIQETIKIITRKPENIVILELDSRINQVFKKLGINFKILGKEQMCLGSMTYPSYDTSDDLRNFLYMTLKK